MVASSREVIFYGEKQHAVILVATNPGCVLGQNVTYTDFIHAS